VCVICTLQTITLSRLYRPSTAGGRRLVVPALRRRLHPFPSSRFLADGSNDVVEKGRRDSMGGGERWASTAGPDIDRRLLTLFTASASVTAAGPRNPRQRHHVGRFRALQLAFHCDDDAGRTEAPRCRGTRWQLLASSWTLR